MNIIKKGIIRSGEYKGWEIEIDDDTAGDTTGYYIYIKDMKTEPNTGYDLWFLNMEELKNELTFFDVDWDA